MKFKAYIMESKYLVFNLFGLILGIILLILGLFNLYDLYKLKTIDASHLKNHSGLIDKIKIEKNLYDNMNDSVYDNLAISFIDEKLEYNLDKDFQYLYDSIHENLKYGDFLTIGLLNEYEINNEIITLEADKEYLGFHNYIRIKTRNHLTSLLLIPTSLFFLYWCIQALRLQRKRIIKSTATNM